MARPRTSETNPASEAVRELREALGQTQQEFANSLKVAITTVARWETTRPPRGPALAKLVNLANENGFFHITEMFRQAVSKALGLNVEIVSVGHKMHFVTGYPREQYDIESGINLQSWAARLSRLQLELSRTDLRPKAKIELAVKTIFEILDEMQSPEGKKR